MLNLKWLNVFLVRTSLALFAGHTFAGEVVYKGVVDSDGAKLHLEVSGRDLSKPLILFLHGGPGDVELGLVPFQVTVGRALEERYLVAYLHQRGAGKSLEVSEDTLTIKNNIQDVHNVISFLKAHYKKDKVTLVGHSWGGGLAALYASEYPETLERLVFISSFQDAQKQAETSLEVTLKWAEREGNQLAIQELQKYQDSPSEHYLLLSKWASRANGGIANGVDIRGFLAAEKIDEEFPGWQERRGSLADKMNDELQAMSVNGGIDHLQIPALFVVGENDSITTPLQVKADYKRYKGSKCFSVLKDSHHLPFMDAAESLEKTMLVFLEAEECISGAYE
ncbi:alpha/beta fold hydrolase [Microbulbifer variabilis]|uniref:Alpha/beta hydrolase n=1 Tax=Microbulbifer variabilis TaxID=266805 RepID=A0ABY4VF35_9GAMM|nr:alpha/beta hydrolase [Microbulbifer variabilis]USD22876.1 alpha/beta hydrolase [Microbulbifer variabilis]